MTTAEKTINTEQEIEATRERLQALGQELAELPKRSSQAADAGDERTYLKLRLRSDAIPRETYMQQLKLLKLQQQQLREQHAAVASTIPGLTAEFERAQEAFKAAETTRNAAQWAMDDAQKERRELEMELRAIERRHLPELLSQAGRV